MNVTFLGAGNLATQMAIALHEHSVTIRQVYSRSMESANGLATKVKATPIIDISAIDDESDYYIFALKDSVLSNLITQMSHKKGIWVHTAGSMPMDIFSGTTDKFGVVYPFQTFSKKRRVSFSNIPIFIEGSDSETLLQIKKLAAVLSLKTYCLSSEKRKYIHLTGVFSCNFVNHLYHISEIILSKENIPFDVLLPLITETAAKVNNISPEEAQTGPALRNDLNVINAHLALLKDEALKEIYKIISEDIYRKNN